MPDVAILGQYYPGTSPVHRMDPRAKILLALAVIVIAFFCQTFASLAVCALFVLAFAACAQIPARTAWRSIAPLMFVVAITVLINLLFTQSGETLAQIGIVRISTGSVRAAAFFGVRLTVLLFAMSLLTLTTPNLDITEAFGRLLGPFARFGVPAHEISMMMGIAFRFLPQFVTEAHQIYQAQLSRGASFAGGAGKSRMQALGALLVPLFASAFRHAETLSGAMESRCYHGGDGRTRLEPLRFTYLDRNGCLAVAAMLACVLAANLLPW